MRRSRFREHGVTLVELVVSIVVISIGLAGILLVMDRTTRSSGDAVVEHQAIAIAEAYLEEILAKPFCDPDNPASACVPGPGNTPGGPNCQVCPPGSPKEGSRDLYDNVCDYNGTDDTPPKKQDGNPPAAGLDAYRVRVAVSVAGVTLGAAGAPLRGDNCEAMNVRVRVTGPGGTDITLSGYRTNY